MNKKVIVTLNAINALEGTVKGSLHDAVQAAVPDMAWNDAMWHLHGQDMAYAEEIGMGCF